MSLQLKISLNGTRPPVWRRLLIPDHYTFMDLHAVIQAAMGWFDSHMFEFSGTGEEIGVPFDDGWDDRQVRDAGKVSVKSELTSEGEKMTYVYDFGDNWQHTVLLEKIHKEKVLHPICLKGKGACPPEDCGGVWSYYELVEQVNDPDHPEYREMRDWLGLKEGETLDVAAFDLQACNDRLRT